MVHVTNADALEASVCTFWYVQGKAAATPITARKCCHSATQFLLKMLPLQEDVWKGLLEQYKFLNWVRN